MCSGGGTFGSSFGADSLMVLCV